MAKVFFSFIILLVYANAVSFADNVLPIEFPKESPLKATSYLNYKQADSELVALAQSEFFDHHEFGAIITPFHELPMNFFAKLWKVWEAPARAKAKKLSDKEKIELAFQRYGFVANPKNPGFPYGIALNSQKKLAFNCLACHVGQINGEPVIGVPNRTISLKTFYEDLAKYYSVYRGGLKSSSKFFPENRGLINAIGSQIGLGMKFRNKDMEFDIRGSGAPMDGSDPTVVAASVNPLPWFGTKKKTHTASDGYLPIVEDHAMIKTSIVPSMTSKAQFLEESKKTDYLYAYIRNIQPPKFEDFGGKIDIERAAAGKKIFEHSCQGCHGVYGNEWYFPNKLIPYQSVGTDNARVTNPMIQAIKIWLSDSWFGEGSKDRWILDQHGYIAPPLDGIWATAPYLHNASVPTIRDLFYPEERPLVFKASLVDYDLNKIGVAYEALSEVPEGLTPIERRGIYDTRDLGHSNAGHPYTSELDADEKPLVMEYLKTL